MQFSREFRSELKKAIKLSTFISVLVFGMILVQYQKDEPNRNIASLHEIEDCPLDAQGNPVSAPSRGAPPFERKPCSAQKK